MQRDGRAGEERHAGGEGRNGRLALWHHHLHRLSARRLAALTVIQNHWLILADGTTTAQRLFEVPHDDPFEWLLDRMDLPAPS